MKLSKKKTMSLSIIATVMGQLIEDQLFGKEKKCNITLEEYYKVLIPKVIKKLAPIYMNTRKLMDLGTNIEVAIKLAFELSKVSENPHTIVTGGKISDLIKDHDCKTCEIKNDCELKPIIEKMKEKIKPTMPDPSKN